MTHFQTFLWLLGYIVMQPEALGKPQLCYLVRMEVLPALLSREKLKDAVHNHPDNQEQRGNMNPNT